MKQHLYTKLLILYFVLGGICFLLLSSGGSYLVEKRLERSTGESLYRAASQMVSGNELRQSVKDPENASLSLALSSAAAFQNGRNLPGRCSCALPKRSRLPDQLHQSVGKLCYLEVDETDRKLRPAYFRVARITRTTAGGIASRHVSTGEYGRTIIRTRCECRSKTVRLFPCSAGSGAG